MSTNDPTLQVQEWTTADGQPVRLIYDPEADLLEIHFPGIEADDAIDLTEHITLHFNARHNRATGVTFLGYRQLRQPGEWGAPSFPMISLNRLPSALRANIIRMLNTPPVDHFLRTATLIVPRTIARPILAVEPSFSLLV